MQTTYYRLVAICLVLLGLCVGHVSAQEADKRKEVIDIATAEIGVYEDIGPNDGHRIREYRAVSDFNHPVPWCAIFVMWVYDQAEIPNTITPWTPSVTPKSKTIYTRGRSDNKTPQPGDAFTIYYASLKREGHTGLIEQWPSGDFCITIEGNTNGAGSREGEEVARKRRLKILIYKVSDWITPIYI